MPKTERQVEANAAAHAAAMDDARARLDYAVASSPFAGRIGGNQEFVVTGRDDDANEVLKKLPDAVRWRRSSGGFWDGRLTRR